MVSCKLTHYITRSSSAESFCTIHVFFICGSVLKFQRNNTFKPNLKNFFLELSHRGTYSTFPAVQKAMLLKIFVQVALVSTSLKLLIIAFHSALKQNTALSDSTDCLLLSQKMTFFNSYPIFLLPSAISPVSQKSFLVYCVWRSAQCAYGLQKMNQEHCCEKHVLNLATYGICMCQFSSSMRDTVSYVSQESCCSLSLLHFGCAACIIS